MVDSTASRLCIDELASLLEQRVFLASQHALFAVHLRIPCRGYFYGHTKMFRESANVARCYLNSFVHGTAVGGAVNAIVIRLGLAVRRSLSHDRYLSPVTYRRFDFLYSANNKSINSARCS